MATREVDIELGDDIGVGRERVEIRDGEVGRTMECEFESEPRRREWDRGVIEASCRFR
jgi:hypothetical protein